MARRPDIAVERAWLKPMMCTRLYCFKRASSMRLAHDVQEILHHRIGRRDHLGVGRIGLLGHDQLGELVGDIGVRALERRTDDGAGLAEQRRAGLVGRLERTAVDALEEVGA
ncbi:hypothetical protein SA9_12410, partial [Staphylococcus warneri]